MKITKKHLFKTVPIILLPLFFFSCFTIEPINESIFIEESIVISQGGHVRSGTLNDDHVVSGFTFSSNTTLFFYNNGQLKEGILNNNHTIDGIHYLGTNIFFHEAGEVRRGIFKPLVKQGQLNSNQVISGITYNDQTWIRLNVNGSVHSSGANYDTNF